MAEGKGLGSAHFASRKRVSNRDFSLFECKGTTISSYKEILIAESASNSTKYKLLSDIKIPRLVSYSVIVDGSSKGYVTDKNTPIPVTSTKDSAFYQNKTETFTVSEIFEGKNIPGVSIDEANEQIIVSTIGWATPITKKFHVHIEPSEAENYFVRHRELLNITRDRWR